MKCDLLLAFPLIIFVLLCSWFLILVILGGISAAVFEFFNPTDACVERTASERKEERKKLILPLIILSVGYWAAVVYVWLFYV
jgi:hypothetical protein